MRKTTIIGWTAAALSALSIFLPFVIIEVQFLGLSKSLSIWQGAELQGEYGLALSLFGMTVLGVICSWLAGRKHLFSIGTLLVFLFITMVACIKLSDMYFLESAGIGLYTMILAGLTGIVSSVLGFMKK